MSAVDEESEAIPQRRRPVGKAPLGLAALALLLCWIPYLGLALALAALLFALRIRRSARVGWALALSVYALVLGGGFTGLQIAFAPEPIPSSRASEWEAFEKLFEPVEGAGGGPQQP